MGYFDGFTANLFRTDAQGRRLYAPYGRRGRILLVSDTAAERITRVWRRFYQGMLLAIIATQIAVGWRWNVYLVGPLIVAASLVLPCLLGRNLPESGVHWDDLPPLTRDEVQTRFSRATGRAVLWPLLIGSALFALTGFWLVVTGAGLTGFGVIGFFGLCTFSFVRQLRRAK